MLPILEPFAHFSYCPPQLPSHAVPVLVPTIHGKQNPKKQKTKIDINKKTRPALPPPLFFTLLRPILLLLCLLSSISFNGEVDLYL